METQGQIVGRRKVGTGKKKKMGEEELFFIFARSDFPSHHYLVLRAKLFVDDTNILCADKTWSL